MKQTIVAPTFVATTTRTTRERNQLDPVEAEEMLTSTGCPLDTHQTLINTAWKNVPVYTSDADLRGMPKTLLEPTRQCQQLGILKLSTRGCLVFFIMPLYMAKKRSSCIAQASLYPLLAMQAKRSDRPCRHQNKCKRLMARPCSCTNIGPSSRYYHATIEVLPWIAHLLDYLRAHPDVILLARFLVVLRSCKACETHFRTLLMQP